MNCEQRRLLLIVLAIIVLFVAVLFLFPLPTPATTPTGPQIVLKFSQERGNVRYFIPQQTMAIGLVPLDAAAPLSKDALSICHLEVTPVALRFESGKEAGPLNDLMFRCGQDRYLFTTLAVDVSGK